MSKGTKLEYKVRDKLYEEGYSPMRVAGSGTWGEASCDVVAFGEDKSLAIECKSLSKSSFPYKVVDDDEQLIEIQNRGSDNLEVIYAVEVTGQTLLRFDRAPAGTLRLGDMPFLYEVL